MVLGPGIQRGPFPPVFSRLELTLRLWHTRFGFLATLTPKIPVTIFSEFNLGSLFSSHWNVVWIAAAAFFLLQIGLCSRFFLRMRRQERKLRALLSDLRQGGDGRGVPDRFAWLDWVHRVFPQGSTTPGSYTRDDVLKELDTRISSSADYLLLQRLGVMAPLLGVILTVLGFWWLKVPDTEEQSLNDILFAVTPLVAGVGIGAILAFINQGLLHVAGIKAEAVRMAARSWFDAAVWSTVGLDTQAATVKAIAGIDKMARTLSDSADKQHEATQWMAESTLAIQESAAEFHDAVQGFGGRIEGLPDTLAELRTAMSSSVETFQSLIPVAERVVAGLDVSVSAFRTAIENQFIEAARLHRTAIADISASTDRLGESTEHLRTGSEDLQDVISSHSSSFRELSRTLKQSLANELLPTHQDLRATVSSLENCVGEFSACMRSLRTTTEALSENIASATRGIGTMASQIEPSVASFREAVDDRFVTAAEHHEENLKTLSSSIEQIQAAGQALAKGATAIERMLSRHAGLEREIEPAQETLQAAIDKIASVGHTFQGTVESHIAPSHQALSRAAGSLTSSAGRLAAFIEQGLDPVTHRLTTLDETLSRLEGTVNAIRDFSRVRKEVGELCASLSQAAEVASAITDLPDQIRNVLEELVSAQQDELNARGNLLTWLRGRPKV